MGILQCCHLLQTALMCFVVCLFGVVMRKETKSVLLVNIYLLMFSTQGPRSKWKSYSVTLDCTGSYSSDIYRSGGWV